MIESTASRSSTARHVAAIVLVSAAYESLFVGHGLNLLDDLWPLRAVHEMAEGGSLYRDVFFVFPPGHLIPAWIGHAIDPPGLWVARIVWAAFAVAAAVALYFLARRIMPAPFAVAAALCVALAAPRSHLMHTVFGYRYLVFSVLALLAFARRLDTGRPGWLGVAGLLLGVGAFFRLTPPFAAGCGLGVAIFAVHPGWRDRVRDWSWLGAGVAIVFVPLLALAALTIGVPELWREIVTRPATMLYLQSLELPPVAWPDEPTRVRLRLQFVALQFRLIWALYLAYGAGLAVTGWRALRRRESFPHGVLLALWTFGAVFCVRSLTRSDEPHLDSIIPPACLLVVHAAWLGWERLSRRFGSGAAALRLSGGWSWAVALALVALWVLLLGTDLWLPVSRRGGHAIEALDGRIEVHNPRQSELVNEIVRRLRLTDPDARILDLSASPGYAFLAGRRGYGALDIVMPGTFLDEAERLEHFDRVRADPPAMVIWPRKPFDNDLHKAVQLTAPELVAWVQEHYQRWGPKGRSDRYLMGPRGQLPPDGFEGALDSSLPRARVPQK